MATRIHVVSAHETNYPWGFENRVIPALERTGFEVIATDFRKHRGSLPRLIRTPADLVLVCKGEGIPPAVIADAPAPRVLWYAEQIGTESRTDARADERRRELAFNVGAFDVVFSHDASNLGVHRALGARRVHWLPTACVNPGVNRPIHASPVHDVTFAGTLTDRRKRLIEALGRRVNVHVASEWDPEALNALLNRSRVVLNLHLSDLPNTETRVAEVLGAGACLVTESLSSPALIEPGRHAGVAPTGDADALCEQVISLLERPAERAAMAAAGHAHVMTHHTLDHRVRELTTIGLGLRQSV